MNLDDDNDADDEKADETKAADAEQTGPEIYVGTATPVADDVLAVSIAVPQLASTDFTQAPKAQPAEPSAARESYIASNV